MKLYKKIAFSFMSLCLAMGTVSCDDFFEPETDDVLDGDEYMAEQTEMYTGFLGIMQDSYILSVATDPEAFVPPSSILVAAIPFLPPYQP